MGTAERRKELMKVLCRRRYDTIVNLALEFGVSERTIRRDIDVLSLTEPIYTQTGRYRGGVYIVDGYSMNRIYMSDKELNVLNELYVIAQKQDKCILNSEQIDILKYIIRDYTKPKIK